jgi:hypothetical protein
MKMLSPLSKKLLMALFAVALVVVSFLPMRWWWLDSGYEEEAKSSWIIPPTFLTEKHVWTNTTIQLYSVYKPGPAVVRAKRCERLRNNVRLTAFVSDNGHTWAGRAADSQDTFYVETESGIFFVFVVDTEVLWEQSEIAWNPAGRNDVDSVIDRLVNKHISDRSTAPQRTEKGGTTTLRCLDGPSRCALDELSLARIDQAVQVIGNAMRLELRSERAKVSVWIDLNSKGLLRVVENGKQVFPKSILEMVLRKNSFRANPRVGAFNVIEAEMTSSGIVVNPRSGAANELINSPKK